MVVYKKVSILAAHEGTLAGDLLSWAETSATRLGRRRVLFSTFDSGSGINLGV
jgi:hypothetical protein